MYFVPIKSSNTVKYDTFVNIRKLLLKAAIDVKNELSPAR